MITDGQLMTSWVDHNSAREKDGRCAQIFVKNTGADETVTTGGRALTVPAYSASLIEL